jgi:hypothetical protein
MEERKYESKKENLIPALGNSHDTGYAAHDGHAGIRGSGKFGDIDHIRRRSNAG